MQPERIHIAAQGFERDRIIEPAKSARVHRVVLLEHSEGPRPDWFSDVTDELESAGITVEPETCNIFDMWEVIGRVSEVVRRYDDADIGVNVATGSKPSAIGSMIACMTTDATPFYVKPEGYGDPDVDEINEIRPVSHGVKDTWELTAYPMERPNKQDIWIMEYISQNTSVSKSALIEFGRGERTVGSGYEPDGRLPFMDKDYTDKSTSNHNRLNSQVLNHLEERGWIETEERGTSIYVELTEEGAKSHRAFRHIIKQ